jgi:hypothetical protein
MVLPSFEREQIYTLVFRDVELEFESVTGVTAQWYSLFRCAVAPENQVSGGDFFVPANVIKKPWSIKIADVPSPFNDWQELKNIVRQDIGCPAATVDGVGYRHHLLDRLDDFMPHGTILPRRAIRCSRS